MTDNDYIAEYIREKRPEIVTSFDFIIWKMCKIFQNSIRGFAQGLRFKTNIDYSDLDRYPGETEDILKKIKESGENKED